MHPLLKRILVNGAISAAFLIVIGAVFANNAAYWMVGNVGRPGSAELNQPVETGFQYRIPAMMAFWGVVLVAVGETMLWSIHRRKRRAAASPATQPDNTEKLLNEILAQEDEKRQEAEKTEPNSEASGQKPADSRSSNTEH